MYYLLFSLLFIMAGEYVIIIYLHKKVTEITRKYRREQICGFVHELILNSIKKEVEKD